MKYIKTYEELEYKYKIGDYVLLDIDAIVGKNIFNNNLDPKDIPKEDKGEISLINKDLFYEYTVKLFNDECGVDNDEIIRKLTPEEIEEYEIKKASLKYNL